MSARGRIYLLCCGASAVVALLLWRWDEPHRGSATGPNRPAQPGSPATPVAESISAPPAPPEADRAELLRHEADPIAVPAPALEQAAVEPRLKASGTASRLWGRVVDDQGAPLAEFKLEFQGLPGNEVPQFMRSLADPQGRFEIDLAELQASMARHRGPDLTYAQWSLRARAGPCESPISIVDVPQVAEVLLIVPRAAEVHGSVLTPDGRPVPGADVFLLLPGEENADLRSTFSSWNPDPRGRSDAQGSFAIRGIQPGDMYVAATHASFCESERVKLSLEPGASTEARLELRAGGTVVGRVDASLGPMPWRCVALFSFRGALGWRETLTDEQGAFALHHVVAQDYVIELRPEGYPEAPPEGAHEAVRKQIRVQEGETTEVVFAESATRKVRVFGVVTCASRPLPEAEIEATAAAGAGDRGTATSASGEYELELLEPGDYWFTISTGRGSSARFERTIPDEAAVALSFDVPGGALVGQVLSPQGKPLSGIPLTILRDPLPEEDPSASYWLRLASMSSDEDGRFAFNLLFPGTYTVRTLDGDQFDTPSPRYPYGRVMQAGIAVGSVPVEGVVLKLTVEGSVAGRVLDGEGSPIGNAWVRAETLDGTVPSFSWDTRTDVSGDFVIHSLSPGTYVVRAHTGELQAASQPVLVEEGEVSSVEVRLP